MMIYEDMSEISQTLWVFILVFYQEEEEEGIDGDFIYYITLYYFSIYLTLCGRQFSPV